MPTKTNNAGLNGGTSAKSIAEQLEDQKVAPVGTHLELKRQAEEAFNSGDVSGALTILAMAIAKAPSSTKKSWGKLQASWEKKNESTGAEVGDNKPSNTQPQADFVVGTDGVAKATGANTVALKDSRVELFNHLYGLAKEALYKASNPNESPNDDIKNGHVAQARRLLRRIGVHMADLLRYTLDNEVKTRRKLSSGFIKWLLQCAQSGTNFKYHFDALAYDEAREQIEAENVQNLEAEDNELIQRGKAAKALLDANAASEKPKLPHLDLDKFLENL